MKLFILRPTVEVARSFSKKVNLGNYEMADFFCSMKAEVLEVEAEAVGKKLVNRCVLMVEQDIEEYLSNRNVGTN